MKANKLINMLAGIGESNEELIDKIICRAINMGVNVNDIDEEIAVSEEISIEEEIDMDYDIVIDAIE